MGYRPVPGRTTFELVVHAGQHVGTTISKHSDQCDERATDMLRVLFVAVVYDGRYVRKVLSMHPSPPDVCPSYDLASGLPMFT